MSDYCDGKNMTIAQTFVRAPDGTLYEVSTINRETSSTLMPGYRYAETVVWECVDGKRGEMFGPLAEAPESSVRGHCEIVARIRNTGIVEAEDIE